MRDLLPPWGKPSAGQSLFCQHVQLLLKGLTLCHQCPGSAAFETDSALHECVAVSAFPQLVFLRNESTVTECP